MKMKIVGIEERQGVKKTTKEPFHIKMLYCVIESPPENELIGSRVETLFLPKRLLNMPVSLNQTYTPVYTKGFDGRAILDELIKA